MASDRWRLRDLRATTEQSSMYQLMSKSILKEGKPIEIHEIELLDGRVSEKFSRYLKLPKIKALDDGAVTVEELEAGKECSEEFELNHRHFSYNPDYSTGAYTQFLVANAKQPGTASANLIRARLLLEGKTMSPETLNELTYLEAIALEEYLSMVFTDRPDPEIS